jgi:hypothetical protein
VILPAYGEPLSKTASHPVGAGFTLSVRHISRLAPQPCGMPYICPLTEFQARFFRNGWMSG